MAGASYTPSPRGRCCAGRSASPSTTTPTDNVYALSTCRCSPVTSGRPGSGLAPLRGQNNVQGGGDMGALPDRLTGFQHVTDDARRQRVEHLWGVADTAAAWQTPDRDDARDGAWRAAEPVRDRRKPGAVRRRCKTVFERLFEGLDFLVVQDITDDRHRAACRRRAARALPVGSSQRARSPTASGESSWAGSRWIHPATRATIG